MRRVSIGLASLVALLAAQASVHAADADKSKPQPCFRIGDIQNSVETSRTQLNIKTYNNQYFQIDTKGICFIGPGNLSYAIKETPGTGGWICKPLDMDLIGGASGQRLPCIVDKITPLTRDQVMALPKKEQPG